VAGGLAAMVLPRRRWWYAVAGSTGGLLVIGGLLATTWGPYDIDAFAEPQLSGELVRVPGLLDAAERNLGEIEQVRDRVDALSTRLAELYATSVGDLPGGAPGETAILHVSDIHLNPLGAALMVRLARDLEVDAVLDTGDVTSFGLSVEANIGSILEGSPVPYLLVPGNHDSPSNRAQLDQLRGVTVLDGGVATVGAVRILGIADPTFTANNEITTSEANDIKASLTHEVRAKVLAAHPDVLAVHDPAQADDALGVVPLVVAGHLHERSQREEDGTLVLTVGSSGAAGLGSFTVDDARPYEAEVLRFQGHDLVAIDYLSVTGIGGEFTLERRLVDQPAKIPTTDDLPPHRPPSPGP
jgi:predicted phosphodiesterase